MKGMAVADRFTYDNQPHMAFLTASIISASPPYATSVYIRHNYTCNPPLA